MQFKEVWIFPTWTLDVKLSFPSWNFVVHASEWAALATAKLSSQKTVGDRASTVRGSSELEVVEVISS